MGTVSPRPRGTDSLGTSLKAARADREQIRRLVSNVPKPKAPGPSGFLGTAHIVSTTGSVGQTGSGTGIEYNSVTYDAPTDPYAGGAGEGLPPSGWCSTAGPMITLTEGWYGVTVLVDVAWATPANAPEFVEIHVDNMPPGVQEACYSRTVDNDRKGARLTMPCGDVYVTQDLSVDVNFGPHSGTTDALIGLGGSPNAQIVWTIVKRT